jgi:hypothetical protein
VTEPEAGHVESYAGASYPTEPRALWWAGQRHVVTQILARWRTPAGPGFRIQTEDGAQFQVEYNTVGDRWRIQQLEASD